MTVVVLHMRTLCATVTSAHIFHNLESLTAKTSRRVFVKDCCKDFVLTATYSTMAMFSLIAQQFERGRFGAERWEFDDEI